MSKIKYPSDWLDLSGVALIINYSELSKLVKANELDSGHLSYIIQAIQDAALSNITRMIEEKNEQQDQS